MKKKAEVDLTQNEISALISKTMRFKPTFIKELLKNAKDISALQLIIAKITMQAMTSENPKDAIACAEWLLSRAVGKQEGITAIGQINQVNRKITYVTTIDGEGNIQKEEHYE